MPNEIWKVQLPDQWKEFHQFMSVSRLLEIEACARRYALNSAKYSRIWPRDGYPQKINRPAAFGQVLHQSIEAIIRQLSKHNCESPKDSLFPQILRSLGGYSKVIESSIESVLEKYKENPRSKRQISQIREWLLDQLPMIREQVQVQINSLNYIAREASPEFKTTGASRLLSGAYSEVLIESDELQWNGIADLIRLSEDSCEIRDFKTGEFHVEHEFQIRVYHLLWMLDRERNPEKRNVTRLVLSYINREVEVDPLNEANLDLLQSELKERTEKARSKINVAPPPASPSPENCLFCNVRQLCAEYWSTPLNAVDATNNFTDLAARVNGNRGPSSWDIEILTCKFLQKGSRAILCGYDIDAEFREQLDTAKEIRVLDAAFSEMRPEEVPVFMLTSFSEIFSVS